MLTDQAVQGLATAALATGQAGEAVAALDLYPETKDKPALLLLRGDAHSAFSQPLQAAIDYQAIYLRFPTSDVAGKAEERLDSLRGTLGGKFPAMSLQHQIEHADTIYGAHQWSNARNEYSRLVTEATGAEKERAELRVLACGVALGASPVSIVALSISDPDVDAERYYIVANQYRLQGREADMLAAIESAAARAPQSSWTDPPTFSREIIFGSGWIATARPRTTSASPILFRPLPYMRATRIGASRGLRSSNGSPTPRILPSSISTRSPASPYTSDALYWLGRLAEESDNVALARAYHQKFRTSSAKLLHAARDRSIPRDRPRSRRSRSRARYNYSSRSAGQAPRRHDPARRRKPASARRCASLHRFRRFRRTRASRRVCRHRRAAPAARSRSGAVNAGHVGAAIVTIRQMYPQLESRPLDEVPREVWFAAYALPFEQAIRQSSAGRRGSDAHGGADPPGIRIRGPTRTR